MTPCQKPLTHPQKLRCREVVAEDWCMLSSLPCSAFLCQQFLALCHHYSLLHLKYLFHSFFPAIACPRHNRLPSLSIYTVDGQGCTLRMCRKDACTISTKCCHRHQEMSVGLAVLFSYSLGESVSNDGSSTI